MDIEDMKLIGSGAEADIYLFEDTAIKIFKNSCSLEAACYEADLQGKVHEAGLPVPEIYEVLEVDGKSVITMEYINGKTFGEMMFEDVSGASQYLELSVDLQIKVHNVAAEGFPGQKEWLRGKITETSYLSDVQKQDLLHQLRNLEDGSQLCHGDFHVLNLIQTSDDVKIIDWVNARKGSAACDVCRSYLLYCLYRPAIADAYIDCYCGKSGLSKQKVLAWLPVTAGARLNENVTENDVEFLLDLIAKTDNFSNPIRRQERG